jgi:hypothetical protein
MAILYFFKERSVFLIYSTSQSLTNASCALACQSSMPISRNRASAFFGFPKSPHFYVFKFSHLAISLVRGNPFESQHKSL